MSLSVVPAKIASSLSLILLALMIFITGSAKEVHALILFALVTVAIVDLTISKRGFSTIISPWIMGWLLIYMLIGNVYCLLGVLNNNPGAMASYKGYVIYPLVLMLMIYGLSHDHVLRIAKNIILLAGGAAATYGICMVGASIGLLPSYLYVDIGVMSEGTGIVIHKNSVGFNIHTLIPMFYVIPFLIGLLLVTYFDGVRVCRPILTTMILVLCIIFVLLTGRRSVVVLAVLSPLIFFAFRAFKSRSKINLRNVALVGVTAVSLITLVVGQAEKYGITFDDRLNSIFEPASDPSIIHKQAQTEFMLKGWMEKPLMGHGHGAIVEGIKSSEDQPWAYEVTYGLLLHNTGLIGMLAYSSGIIWIYWNAIRIIRRSDYWANMMVPVMMGLTGFLIANLTNPYLGQIDSLWVLCYPLAIINMLITRKNGKLLCRL